MRLWIDGQCFQTASRLRGIGRYVHELMLGIVENHPEVELIVSFNAAMALEALAAREHFQKWINPANLHMWHGVAEGGEAIFGYTEKRRLSEIALAYHVACLKPDIALSASPFEGVGEKAVPLAPNAVSGVPIASIFYDAIPSHYPKQYLTTTALRAYNDRRLAFYSQFDLNLCISEYSRADCVEISKNPSAINILAGVSRDFKDAVKYGGANFPRPTEKPFVLYVGALDWRKNVRSAIEAFAKLPEDIRNNYSFVLAGDHPKTLIKDEEDRWNELGLPEKDFIPIGHVTDSQLVSLYKTTDLAIQPSLLEGFGLTALEAMTCGTPVIASNTGALPEVIGNQSFLFDPADVTDIARVMRQALSDPRATKALADTQRARAAEFSWARSASIAVAGLKQATKETAKVASMSAAQSAVLEDLRDTSLPSDLVADTLARSETSTALGRRLIVDATSTFRLDHKTGIQRVVRNICSNLTARIRMDSEGLERIVAYSDSFDGWFRIPNPVAKATDAIKFTEDARLELGLGDTILMLDSSWELSKYHYSTLRAARMKGATVVSCLYDTIPLRFPGFCTPVMPPIFSRWFQTALSYSTGFVCISKAVADEFIAILEAIQFPREMRIGYWHLGADFLETAAGLDRRRDSGSARFLMVGTLEPRKGHAVALDAFDRLWKDGADVELTIVGKPGWGVEHLVRRIEQHSAYGKRLFWFKDVSDEELQKAYAGTDALIAASYAEGFGLPIVEAGHFGKPVISSDIAVFREVTERGQNCRFFATGSSASLADEIQSFLVAGVPSSAAQVDAGRMTWRESTEELQRVVLNDEWYKIYRPRSDRTYVSISDLGQIRMRESLLPRETRHNIDLIDGPTANDDGRTLNYIVRITNLSAKLWASAGPDGSSLGVFASFRILSRDGKPIAAKSSRAPIPFVLPPGDSLYLSIAIPLAAKKKGGFFAEIGLVQESVGWWRDSIRVSL